MLSSNPILQIASEQYDAGLLFRDPLPLLWATMQVPEPMQSKALAEINSHRERHGLMPVYRYGHSI